MNCGMKRIHKFANLMILMVLHFFIYIITSLCGSLDELSAEKRGSFLISAELILDRVIHRQCHHVDDITSGECRMQAFENLAYSALVFQKVVGLPHRKRSLADMRLLTCFYHVLWNADEPTGHTGNAARI